MTGRQREHVQGGNEWRQWRRNYAMWITGKEIEKWKEHKIRVEEGGREGGK